MSQIVEMNGLRVEQRNGEIWINGKLLTDDQKAAKSNDCQMWGVWFSAGLLSGAALVAGIMS